MIELTKKYTHLAYVPMALLLFVLLLTTASDLEIVSLPLFKYLNTAVQSGLLFILGFVVVISKKQFIPCRKQLLLGFGVYWLFAVVTDLEQSSIPCYLMFLPMMNHGETKEEKKADSLI